MPNSFNAEDVARVAEGLTPDERDGLLNGQCAVPATASTGEWSTDCLCGHKECEALIGVGLATPRGGWPGGVIRTPLGLAVRQHLMEQSHAD